MSRDDEFVTWVAARAPALRRTAYLLCGDWHTAEDLTQEACARLYTRWSRLERRDALDAYARAVLTRLWLDRRRLRSSDEPPVGDPGAGDGPDGEDPAHLDEQVAERLDLVAALDTLSPRHRAVLVLRFWEDLPVAAVAQVLDLPEGTVKSATSRALEALKVELARRGLLIDVTGEG
jgi:RNA polymerase sigma-70 factor (sigma-E family)